MNQENAQPQNGNGVQLTRIETDKGELALSPSIVRKYLVSGNGNVTDQEVMMFIALCKYQKLNPFLREVYLIKYGNDKPATMVTGKETFLKRAMKNPKYLGHKTGISDDGKQAWAEVYIQGYAVPIRVEVDFDEYAGYTFKNGSRVLNRMWSEKPKTMLKKVALVQALREAFPEDFGGLYSQEEINSISQPLPENEIPHDVSAPRAKAEAESQEAVTKAEDESQCDGNSNPRKEYSELIELSTHASKKVKDRIHEIKEEHCSKVEKTPEEFNDADYQAILPLIREALK